MSRCRGLAIRALSRPGLPRRHGERALRANCSYSSLRRNNRAFQTEAVGVDRRRGTGGLYGFDVLKSAKGFQEFAETAIRRSEEVIDLIKQTPPSMETIRLFDELSDTICTVVDSAELCRNTHPDVEYVQEASQASLKLYEYLNRLNTNSILYDAIVKVEQFASLTTEEAKRAAHTHKVEFERGGVHLPNEKLTHSQKLNLNITNLGREFVENILRDPGHIDVFPSSKVPRVIQRMVEPILRCKDGTIRTVSKGDVSRKGVEYGTRVITESENLSSLLKWAKDREVRKQAYIKGYSVPKENLGIIDDLIATRHKLAQIMGYKSFAEYTLAPTMAVSPHVVNSFLLEFSEAIRGKADE